MSLYLAIGGIDGSGKSSVQRMLVEHLRSRGQDVVGFAEPYHSFVKELLELTDDPWADVLLFALDRRLLRPSIQQWRSEDRTMVCSRAMYCSVAYQSAQGVPWEDILKANQWESLILPDLYFILDADPKLAFPRCSGREKFERESFLADVREQYLEIYRRRQMFPSRMIMVDAGRPLEQVYRSVLSAVEKEME